MPCTLNVARRGGVDRRTCPPRVPVTRTGALSRPHRARHPPLRLIPTARHAEEVARAAAEFLESVGQAVDTTTPGSLLTDEAQHVPDAADWGLGSTLCCGTAKEEPCGEDAADIASLPKLLGMLLPPWSAAGLPAPLEPPPASAGTSLTELPASTAAADLAVVELPYTGPPPAASSCSKAADVPEFQAPRGPSSARLRQSRVRVIEWLRRSLAAQPRALHSPAAHPQQRQLRRIRQVEQRGHADNQQSKCPSHIPVGNDATPPAQPTSQHPAGISIGRVGMLVLGSLADVKGDGHGQTGPAHCQQPVPASSVGPQAQGSSAAWKAYLASRCLGLAVAGQCASENVTPRDAVSQLRSISRSVRQMQGQIASFLAADVPLPVSSAIPTWLAGGKASPQVLPPAPPQHAEQCRQQNLSQAASQPVHPAMAVPRPDDLFTNDFVLSLQQGTNTLLSSHNQGTRAAPPAKRNGAIGRLKGTQLRKQADRQAQQEVAAENAAVQVQWLGSRAALATQ